MLLLRLNGFNLYFLNLASHIQPLQLSGVTTLELYTSPPILFFMQEPSTLKLTSILWGTWLLPRHLMYILSPLMISWQTYWQNRYLPPGSLSSDPSLTSFLYRLACRGVLRIWINQTQLKPQRTRSQQMQIKIQFKETTSVKIMWYAFHFVIIHACSYLIYSNINTQYPWPYFGKTEKLSNHCLLVVTEFNWRT